MNRSRTNRNMQRTPIKQLQNSDINSSPNMATSTSTVYPRQSRELTPTMVYPRYVIAPAITPLSSPVIKTPPKYMTPERRESRPSVESTPDVQRALVYPENAVEGQRDNSFADAFGLPALESTPCHNTPSWSTRRHSSPHSTPVSTPGSKRSHLSCQSASPSSTVNTTGYASASPHSSPELTTFSSDSSTTSCGKGGRTTYTTEQVRILEKVFFREPYPEAKTIENLSHDINVPESKIRTWFQNKRARSKRPAPFHMPVMVTSSPPTPTMSPVSTMQPIHPAAYYSPYTSRMFQGSYLPTRHLATGMYTFSLPMFRTPHSSIHTNPSMPVWLSQSERKRY